MPENKITVGLICGGKSGEHEVSLISGENIQKRLDRNKYNVWIIGVDKEGHWHLGSQHDYSENSENVKNARLNLSTPIVSLEKWGDLIERKTGQCLAKIDVFFPITHGAYGEDGTLQGILRWMEVPYVGPDVLGSAIGMDKDVSKRLLKEAGLPVTPSITLRKQDTLSFEKAVSILGTPLFIKPSGQGSSIGIKKAIDSDSYEEGLQIGFSHGTKVLVEQFIEAREIECSVLGNETPEASKVLGEVVPPDNVYSFHAKYIKTDTAPLIIPAELESEVIEKIRNAAIQTFQTLECEGMARIDFFVKDDGSFFVNEVNTLPGFTNASMYPLLWEASGLPYSELLDRLIDLARERFQREKHL